MKLYEINSKKKYLFTVEERIDMIRKELQERNIQNVEIVYYEGLLVNMCKEYNAQTIIRGLRAVTDFEYENQVEALRNGNAELAEQLANEHMINTIKNISDKGLKNILDEQEDKIKM